MMAPFSLENETLGKKHRNYNKKLNDLISRNPNEKPNAINFNDSDIENLLKIDIACRQKDVEYILEVFKCKDMLYVTRSIKQVKWLIIEPQYAHIINPTYIHDELLPCMSTKAYHKLMLYIRLHLRDEERVDMFYTYLQDTDLKRAFKWLYYASPTLIQKVLKQHGKIVPLTVTKRLCKKSNYILEYCKDIFNMNHYDEMKEAQEILRNDHTMYMKFLNIMQEYEIPKLSANKTKKIMKNCPDEIVNNIAKFISKVHIATVAKHISSKHIQAFLEKNSQNPYYKPLYKYDKLKCFIKRLPEKDRIDFVKTVFLEKTEIKFTVENDLYNNTMIRCLTNMNNEYLWYELMPFDLAFIGLKKLIGTASNPLKKCNMLCLLLSCARGCEMHLQEILQYYNIHHINEAFKYKSKFVKHFLSKVDTYHFENTTWNLLNNVFYSMGIYNQFCKNKVDECVDCILLYNIINGYKVPDVIISKFRFKTFKNIHKKLSEEEKTSLLEFLIKFNSKKLQQYNIVEEKDFLAILECFKNLSDMSHHYKKRLDDFPTASKEMNDIIVYLVSQSRTEDLREIYNIGFNLKNYVMLNNSIFISETENDCINALRYAPHLLLGQVKNIIGNSKLPKRRFFQKLRVFWHDSLAIIFKDTYFKILTECSCDNADTIGNIMTLLSQNETEKLLQKYLVTDCRKNSSLQKSIVNHLHKARPTPSIEILSSNINNVNVSYVSVALNCLLSNYNSLEARPYVYRLYEMYNPLRKVALKLAFTKLKHNEIVKLFHEAWLVTKNRSLRSLLFKLTFSMLSSSNKDKETNDIWELLDSFIGDLGLNEHKSIYGTLCNIKKCPIIVLPHYYKRVAVFLKNLPNGNYYKNFDNGLSISDSSINWILDIDYVLKKMDADIKNLLTKHCYAYWLPDYLMDVKDEKTQMERYNAILVPLLDYVLCTDIWQTESPAKKNFLFIMERLYNFIGTYQFNKKIVLPITMFSDIQSRMENGIPYDENYFLLRYTKFAVCYLKVANTCLRLYENKHELSTIVCESFGKVCVEQLNEDIKKYSTAIYSTFSQALDHIIYKLEFCGNEKMHILQGIMTCNPSVEGYKMVVELLPREVFNVDQYNLRSCILLKLKDHPLETVRMHLHNHFLRV
ncbi:uncharacterized protein LOC119840458 [Zerene cesonia]|uniref:uncharacterized protein LOC119840458 n=1 Tax=Zerene cesonia TaxID=33412 RepID=UPI0018E4EAF5|nr:uncharacterized protein LOC119840458 [Zerene cesonia]